MTLSIIKPATTTERVKIIDQSMSTAIPAPVGAMAGTA